jgi:peptidoglycan hydrolase CwlO-like protein
MHKGLLLGLALLLIMLPAAPAQAQDEETGDTGEEESTPTNSPALTPSPSPAPLSAEAQKLKQNADELAAREKELADLNQKIEQLKAGEKTAATQADLAAGQVARLTGELNTAELRFEQTTLTISEVNRQINQAGKDLAQGEEDIKSAKEQLAVTLRALYEHDQTTLIDVMLGQGSLSSVLSDRRVYEALQQRTVELIAAVKEKQQRTVQQRDELREEQRQLEKLKLAQAYQQADINEKRSEQREVLRRREAEQAGYERRIAEAEAARQEIQQKIFTVKGAGLEIALDDAFSAARFASARTGVRPALLLAILKVETNVGENLGSGVFPADMHPDSREPFLRLMKKLGRDPNNTPMSRRPTAYAGWGGAIGPGQFMPQTWELLEPRIAQLAGKSIPDPFTLADVLVGVGIMMADRGAADKNKEAEAVARYLAGPNWMYHLWYSSRVLAVADEYVREGLL